MALGQNVIRGWATTIIGLVTMVISLVLVWQKVFDFVWEGIGGLAIGAILLMAPRTIEKAIIKGIDAWGNARGTTNYYEPNEQPPTPPPAPDEDKMIGG